MHKKFKKQAVAILLIMLVSVSSAFFVQQHMYGYNLESHYHKRWWNGEVLLHFSNALGRYNYRSFKEHYFAVSMPCDHPETEPCTSLDIYDLNDKENLAFNAVVPSDKIKGEGVYTSFPPGGFILSYLPVHGMAEILNVHPNSALRLWNRSLQLLTTLILFWTFLRLIPLTTKFREFISALSVVPMFLAVEQLHAHHTTMWAHQVYQPFIAATLFLLTFKPTIRNTVVLGVISAISCWIEWTAYLACIGVSFAVLALTPKGQKIRQSCLYAVLAMSGGISLLAYYAWLIGIESYIYNLTVRFGIRGKVDYYDWYDWFVSLAQSYGAWLIVFLVLLPILVFIPFSKNLGKKWAVILSISGFILVENILMFEHSITYTFDRLKWGFFISAVLAATAVRLGEKYPKASIILLGSMCVFASYLSVIQFLDIYVPYW